MTHPPAGPSTPPPPSGPRAVPLTAEKRVDNYRRQTGRTELTPAQRRRAVKKARGEAVRYLAARGFSARVWK